MSYLEYESKDEPGALLKYNGKARPGRRSRRPDEHL